MQYSQHNRKTDHHLLELKTKFRQHLENSTNYILKRINYAQAESKIKNTK